MKILSSTLSKVQKKIEILEAQNSLLKFTQFTKKDYDTNWHHVIFCNKLELFFEKKIKRLMIWVPPRHGKSEVVSRRFPAYCFGRKPDSRIIACSYGAELSSLMNRDVQRVMSSDEYHCLFPGSSLNSKNVRTDSQGSYIRNSDMFEIVNHKGVYRSAGVGGPITGTGADYLLIDDPTKNKEEAESKTIQEKIIDWYDSTAYSRLEKDGSVLIVMTRWHVDDLAGKLLERAKNDPMADQWEVVSFPAIKDEGTYPEDNREIGEALWPNKYPVEVLTTMKHSMGSKIFNSLYQQSPTLQSGSLFKRAWIKYYTVLPALLDEWLLSLDASFKCSDDSDYVVFQVWARRGAEYYLHYQVRDRMDFPTTVQVFKALIQKFPQVNKKLVEVKANGQAIVDTLKTEIYGIIEVCPTDSKVSRASSVAPMFEAGNVFVKENEYWTQDYVEEVCNFPYAKNDDQVDCSTQALEEMKGKGSDYYGVQVI